MLVATQVYVPVSLPVVSLMVRILAEMPKSFREAFTVVVRFTRELIPGPVPLRRRSPWYHWMRGVGIPVAEHSKVTESVWLTTSLGLGVGLVIIGKTACIATK